MVTKKKTLIIDIESMCYSYTNASIYIEMACSKR